MKHICLIKNVEKKQKSKNASKYVDSNYNTVTEWTSKKRNNKSVEEK